MIFPGNGPPEDNPGLITTEPPSPEPGAPSPAVILILPPLSEEPEIIFTLPPLAKLPSLATKFKFPPLNPVELLPPEVMIKSLPFAPAVSATDIVLFATLVN